MHMQGAVLCDAPSLATSVRCTLALPREELEYRQAVRNIGRLMRCSVLIPRTRRAELERFLRHPNERVRQLAKQLFAEHDREVARLRAEREAEREEAERAAEEWSRCIGGAVPWTIPDSSHDIGDPVLRQS